MAIAASAELKYENSLLELRGGAWVLGLREFLPRLTVDTGGDERLSTIGADSFNKSIGLSLSQTVWDGGKLWLTRSIESLDIELARQDLRRKTAVLVESALDTYRALVSARERLSIRQTSLDSTLEQQKILALELSLGLATESDLLDTDQRISEMRLESASATIDVQSAELELARMLGLDALPGLREKLILDGAPAIVDSYRLEALAVARSPELIAIRNAYMKKKTEAEMQRQAWIPSVTLKAGAQASGSKFPLTRLAWTLGLTLNFSGPWMSGSYSLSGGKDSITDTTARSNVQAEVLPQPQAALTPRNMALALELETGKLRLAEESLRRSVQAGVRKYALMAQKRDLIISSVGLAESKLTLMVVQLELGKKTRLELIEAQIAISEKKLAFVDATAAFLKAGRELEKMADLSPGQLSEMTSIPEVP